MSEFEVAVNLRQPFTDEAVNQLGFDGFDRQATKAGRVRISDIEWEDAPTETGVRRTFRADTRPMSEWESNRSNTFDALKVHFDMTKDAAWTAEYLMGNNDEETK